MKNLKEWADDKIWNAQNANLQNGKIFLKKDSSYAQVVDLGNIINGKNWIRMMNIILIKKEKIYNAKSTRCF